jgi:hypothetical protein
VTRRAATALPGAVPTTAALVAPGVCACDAPIVAKQPAASRAAVANTRFIDDSVSDEIISD